MPDVSTDHFHVTLLISMSHKFSTANYVNIHLSLLKKIGEPKIYTVLNV